MKGTQTLTLTTNPQTYSDYRSTDRICPHNTNQPSLQCTLLPSIYHHRYHLVWMKEGTTNTINVIQALCNKMLMICQDLNTEHRHCMSAKTRLATIEAATTATDTALHTIECASTPYTKTLAVNITTSHLNHWGLYARKVWAPKELKLRSLPYSWVFTWSPTHNGSQKTVENSYLYPLNQKVAGSNQWTGNCWEVPDLSLLD